MASPLNTQLSHKDSCFFFRNSCAELLAQHVAGASLPEYSRWFLPSRYEDAAYRALVSEWGPLAGQL